MISFRRFVGRVALVAVVLAATVLAANGPFTLLTVAISCGVGAFLIDRRPRNSVGWLVLAIGLYRSPVVSRASAVLTGMGIAAVYISASGPVKSVIVGSAVIALVGLGWIALGLWSRRALVATAGVGAQSHSPPAWS